MMQSKQPTLEYTTLPLLYIACWLHCKGQPSSSTSTHQLRIYPTYIQQLTTTHHSSEWWSPCAGRPWRSCCSPNCQSPGGNTPPSPAQRHGMGQENRLNTVNIPPHSLCCLVSCQEVCYSPALPAEWSYRCRSDQRCARDDLNKFTTTTNRIKQIIIIAFKN